MKLSRIIICFFILIFSGFIIIYGQNVENNWINQFIQTFELTNADFKFYNVKANLFINQDISMSELEIICNDLLYNLDIDKDKVDLKKDKQEIYLKYNNRDLDLSLVAIKKSKTQSYIIVDILNNKVYKNIEETYNSINNTLDKYNNKDNNSQIDVCIAGEYTKKLQSDKCNDILEKILYNMNAEKINDIKDENFLSVNAYSKLLEENNLQYLNEKINLNIGIRYSEDENKTMIYIATPIIKIDY